MRKILPKFVLVFLLFVFIFQVVLTPFAFAQRDDRVQPSGSPTPVTQINLQPGTPVTIPDNTWVQDKEVTFTGKNAARAGLLLNWVLRDYKWMHLDKKNKNPIENFWKKIRDIVYRLLILFVIVTAFILITTRGRSIKAMRFIPRFIAVVLLVTFSFALIQLMYEATDVIQGYFLKSKENGFCPPDCISQQDLLFVGWDYRPFFGIRLYGEQFEESAFISLLLVKLTALTYYVMVGVLLIRKIILWLFIIVSPIFPLLLLYYPVRNTAKIWLGEFFRWLLYAPLFAIFLGGLVSLWGSSIPMNFDFSKVHKANQVIFPTAINILIGGPRQLVNLTNSVNLEDTFALYLVALLMLWGVIIVPWILLQIFLDYAFSYNYTENPVFRQLLPFLGNKPPSPPPTPPPSSAGTARTLPFKDFIVPQMPRTTGMAKQIPVEQQIQRPARVPLSVNRQVNQEILRLTNLSVPTMRDIARYESSLMSRDTSKRTEITRIKEQLSTIANPTSVAANTIRDRLTKESKAGNALANSILTAATSSVRLANLPALPITTQQITNIIQHIAKPETVSNPVERQKIITIKDRLTKESKVGNQLAIVIVNATKSELTEATSAHVSEKLKEAKGKGDPLAKAVSDAMVPAGPSSLPNINRIQQVSLDDYEAVKKMWSENYHNMDVPQTISGAQDRKAWVREDVRKISDTINLLSSTDPRQVEEGMQEVSNILPFLLMGGFSQSEIIAYLKAKQEAGKSVLEVLEKTQQDEEAMVEAKRTTQKVGHMEATIEQPLEENPIVALSEQPGGGTQNPQQSANESPKQPETGHTEPHDQERKTS